MKLRNFSTLLLLTSLVSCSGCEKQASDFINQFAATFGNAVDIPTSDTTPPTVSLIVADQGSGKSVVTQNGSPITIDMTGKSGVFAIAVAEDPEGVKQVGFVGGASLQCKQGDIGYLQSADLQGPNSSSTASKALTRLWLPDYVDDTYLQCSQGWTRESASMTLQAVGVNYGGQTVQSQPVPFTWR